MREDTVTIGGLSLPFCSANTLVVGSGAAGLKAAVSLHDLGQDDVVVVTEAWGGGTSNNAGSDKQTYYKLVLAGDALDSPRQMAEDLFAGGSMHGDVALAEAQHSAQAFYHLVALGVPFPHDAYGAFPGYRTDHDARGRATSAGPLTSHLMVAALACAVQDRGIRILDGHQVVALLVDTRRDERCIAGAIALDTRATEPRFVLFSATNVVFATGGPGIMYADSVYPAGQDGSIGAAFRVGAIGQNLTESQFGLASIGFRWNVSGSYQQVVPRYFSTDADGGNEREFLPDAFADMRALSTAVFRKGYEWPFDPRKVRPDGSVIRGPALFPAIARKRTGPQTTVPSSSGTASSLIDLLVHRERIARGRRVFLDYGRNPAPDREGTPFSLESLDEEARRYLARCGATGATPFERLRQMNEPAIELYRRNGIDLARDPLEIAVCAQHNNGGLLGNRWWESNVRGLFPVGEVNGSHGVYRPGGAALNAGQVGALRAAMYIARRRSHEPLRRDAWLDACAGQVADTLAFARSALSERAGGAPRSPNEVRSAIQARMSASAAHVREPAGVAAALDEAWALYREITRQPSATSRAELREAFRNRDLCLAHALYLEAIAEYIGRGGRSRGSYLVTDPAGEAPCTDLDSYRFVLNEPGTFVDRHVLEVSVDEALCVRKTWTSVRPIPETDPWFETVWKAYREDKVIT
jgi:succinate dehydrogenase/fumarate reductase flavoprotein subunit